MEVYTQDNCFRVSGATEELDSMRFAAVYAQPLFKLTGGHEYTIGITEDMQVVSLKKFPFPKLTALERAYDVPTASPEEWIVVSADTKSFIKVQAESVRFAGNRLFYTDSGTGTQPIDVYMLGTDGWKQAITGLYKIIKSQDGFILGEMLSGKQVLINEKNIRTNIPNSMKFEVCKESSSQIPFKQYDEYGIFDMESGSVLVTSEAGATSRGWEAVRNPRTGNLIWFFPDCKTCLHEGRLISLWHKEDSWIQFDGKSAPFRSKYAELRSEDEMCLMNLESGETSPVYDDIIEEKTAGGTVFITYKNGKRGRMTSDLKVLFPAEYDSIDYVHQNNTYRLKKNHKYGRADVSGNWISPLIWDWMATNDTGISDFILVKLNGKITALTPQAGLISEPVWDDTVFGLRSIPAICFVRREKTENDEEKKCYALINIHTKEVIFEGEFDDAEHIKNTPYLKLTREHKTAFYNLKEKCYAVDFCLCSMEQHHGKIKVISTEQEFELS